jgi:hypothetical protein
MQCHNHPWERAEAVAKSAAAGKWAGGTGSKKHCNAMQPGRENGEALGSNIVTGPAEEKKKWGFPVESWVTLTFPTSTCFSPGPGHKTQPYGQSLPLPKTANAFKFTRSPQVSKTPKTPPRDNFTKAEIRQHVKSEPVPCAKPQSLFRSNVSNRRS